MISIIIIIIMIILAYLCLCYLCYLYKKDREEMEKRILHCEKRNFDNEKLIKLEIKGVLNNIDIRDQNFLKYNEVINNRIKNIEKKVKKWLI